MSKITGYPLHHADHAPRREPALWSALGYLIEPIRRFNAVNELEQLSDRQLQDIGVERRQIAEIADREIGRLRAHASARKV
jgi:uncharacterized protein YjiS (DUF1127 family)